MKKLNLEKQITDLIEAIDQASDEEAKGKGFIIVFAKDNEEDNTKCSAHVSVRGYPNLLVPALASFIEHNPKLFDDAKKYLFNKKMHELFSGALGSIN